MYLSSTRFKPSRLGLAVGLSLLVAQHAVAADLGDGESATVGPGDAVEEWFLEDKAVLNVTPGGETGRINGFFGAQVNIDGGTVSTSDYAGISLVDSNATLKNAVISSSNSIGLSLTNLDEFFGGTPETSQVSASDSLIRGGTVGAELSSSVLILERSQVIGGELGIKLSGGELDLSDGSLVSGRVGLEINPAEYHTPEMDSTVILEGVHIEGREGSAIVVNDQAEAYIEVNNGSSLSAGNGVLLDVKSGATADFSVSNSFLFGDIRVEEGGYASVELTDRAMLTGHLENVDDLTISDGALWQATNDAQVGSLVLDQGTVQLTENVRQLSLGELEGNGVIALGNGKLLVSGDANGDFDLQVQSSGYERQDATLVSIGGGDARFALQGEPVDVGAFAYDLRQDGNDWSLAQALDRKGKARLSSAGYSVLGVSNAVNNVWQDEFTSVRGRLDGLRGAGGSNGLWIDARTARHDVSKGALDYQQRQSGFTLGADTAVTEQLRLGAMAGHSNSALDLRRGSKGEIESYYLGMYASWVEDNGFYLDGVLKANQLKNTVKVTSSDGAKAKGDYSAKSVGASLEAGRKFQLGQGWYLQPFAQLSTVAMQGQSYQLSNGLQADVGALLSTSGKLGSQFGLDIPLESGGRLQPYLRLALADELSSNAQVKLNGYKFNNDLAGRRTEAGVGVASHLTPSLRINTDLEFSRGKYVDQPYGVNLGLQYSF